MKAVIQRVLNASVVVEGQIVSSIGLGLCVFIGIYRDDTVADIDPMVKKILRMRIYDDKNTGKNLTKSVIQKDYDVLCISQVTLYHSFKGHRPDFHTAMVPKYSEGFFKKVLVRMRHFYRSERIKGGVFGAHQLVSLQNDGPFTIALESPQRKNR